MHNDTVSRRDNSLLADIERGALDDNVPLATTLRRCIALGAQARNAELRDWATRELNGYRDNDAEIPKYRMIYAPLNVDLVSFRYQVTGQQISVLDLPEFARELVGEEVTLAQGVGDIEALVRNAQRTSKTSIKMAPPGAAELMSLMTHERQGQGVTVTGLYWDVHVARIEGVLDQIRTTLVRLASEIRATMSDDASVPSAEQAAQAVNVVLHGGKRNQVTVTAAQAGNGGRAEVKPADERGESGWTKTQTVWTVIGSVAGIIALGIAYLQLHG